MNPSHFDYGMQEDFNNMTYELGRPVGVAARNSKLGSDTFEVESGYSKTFGTTGIGFPIYFSAPITREIAFVQELNTRHDVIRSGQMNLGDVKVTFMSNSIAQNESSLFANGNHYKILQLTKVKGLSSEEILYIKAFGKKIPNR